MATGRAASRARRAKSKASSSSSSSRTTRTSRGNETVSQTVDRAKAMLGSSYNPNTKAPSRSRMDEIANQDFVTKENRDAYYKSRPNDAITPDKLEKVEAVEIPGIVSPVGAVPDMNITNAGLGDVEGGMFKEYVADAGAGAAETAAVDSANVLGSQIGDYLGIGRPDPDANEDALRDARYEAGVAEAQREYNRYQNQINSITAQRDADMLGLEGQGRGITDTIIGGQQARISREAAIMAMPIQAQLAAAQGNLEVAKELMGQLYQAKSADIQADLAYRTNLGNSMMQYATASQQAILQGKMADISNAAAIKQQNLARQQELADRAIEYGQGHLVTGISGIDTGSQTFERDMSRYLNQLRKPTSPIKRSTQVIDRGDGMKQLIDTQTGEVIETYGSNGGAGGAGSLEVQEAESANRTKFVDDLVGLATHEGLNSSVGPLGVNRWAIGDIAGAKDDFVGSVENVLQTLTLNSFAEAKDRGMTFGAMSQGEWDILSQSATKMTQWRERNKNQDVVGYDISETAFIEELDSLTQFARLDAVIKGTPAADVGVSIVVNPETGATEYWSLNSQGEPTLIRK